MAVADGNGDAADRLAERYAARRFESIVELLSCTAPDVVHVCTPLGTHQRLAELAIDAGAHVLVEKPLTESAEAAERLYARAVERRVLVAPVHQYLFQAGVVETVRRLPLLSEVLHAQAVFCSAGAGTGRELEARGDAVVSDILPHPLSLFEALWPGALARAEWTAVWPGVGELRAQARVGRTTLAILVSMSARPTRAALWLAGSRGSVELDFFHGFALRERGGVSRLRKAARPFTLGARLIATAASNLGRRALAGAPAYPGLNELVRSFYQAVQDGRPAPITPGSAIAVARSREQIMVAAGL